MIRETKLVPNKVTRKHVPALISMIANNSTSLIRKPKFYVEHLRRIEIFDLFVFQK